MATTAKSVPDVVLTSVVPNTFDRFITPAETAGMLGIKPSTLADWRSAGAGPPFCRLGSNLVRYRRSHVVEWISSHASEGTTK